MGIRLMKVTKTPLIALFVVGTLALFTRFSRADETPRKTYEVETHLDIAYRDDKDADPIRHKLDIYTPKGQKDFPVLMFVHGGSWKSGNKTMYAAVGNTFAKQGIGTVVINYRLSDSKGKAKHPDHIKDVASAFAWVHANIGKFGGRNDRIFISGHSAGGHLVALLATDESYLKEHKLGLNNIRGVMPISGVYEITPGFFAFVEPFGKDADICKAASPMQQVKTKHPPFLICYGDRDFPTIDKMSESFCKKLTDGKCEARALKVDSRNHLSIILQLALDSDDPCTKAMFDFIAKHSEWKRPVK
jgi:acetyl esterase/lipase